MSAAYLLLLFVAKVIDNTLNTAKTILIQRNECLLAGVFLALSNYIYFQITKNVVSSNGNTEILVVSIASGVGCFVAVALNNRLSKDKTYVNVIMSDDIEAMKELRDFLAKHHITNTANDSYTLDWSRKTITITAYAETKDDSKLIDNYLNEFPSKFKRVIHND